MRAPPSFLERIVLLALDHGPRQIGELGNRPLADEPAIAKSLYAAETHGSRFLLSGAGPVLGGPRPLKTHDDVRPGRPQVQCPIFRFFGSDSLFVLNRARIRKCNGRRGRSKPGEDGLTGREGTWSSGRTSSPGRGPELGKVIYSQRTVRAHENATKFHKPLQRRPMARLRPANSGSCAKPSV